MSKESDRRRLAARLSEPSPGTVEPPRTNPSVGNPLDRDRVARVLMNATDGATVSAQGQPYTGDGILVALPGHGIVVTPRALDALDAAGLTLWDLAEAWVDTRAPIVTEVGASPARYYGVWHQEADGDIPEAWHFDVVEAYSSAEEDRAIAAGKARGEIAIWHNGRKEEVYL